MQRAESLSMAFTPAHTSPFTYLLLSMFERMHIVMLRELMSPASTLLGVRDFQRSRNPLLGCCDVKDSLGNGGCHSVFSSLTRTGTDKSISLFPPDFKENSESSVATSDGLTKMMAVWEAQLCCGAGLAGHSLMLVLAREMRSDTSASSGTVLSAEALMWRASPRRNRSDSWWSLILC